MQPDVLVFSVDGERYCWRDVILSAVRRGDWRAAERRARQGTACVRFAEETGAALPPGALDAAAREFRYAHDLVTAVSMEEWLTRHELSLHDWTACLRRNLQRARATANLDELARRYPISDEEAARLTLIDALCSSELSVWARALAERAAAHAYLRGSATSADDVSTHTGEPFDTSPVTLLWGDDASTLNAAA